MTLDLADDHKKFTYALVARDLRRMTAMLHTAALDEPTKRRISGALEQLQVRVMMSFFHDPVCDTLLRDPEHYSDGRPVTTTVDWASGFATVVHCPDATEGVSGSASAELSEEMWPEDI